MTKSPVILPRPMHRIIWVAFVACISSAITLAFYVSLQQVPTVGYRLQQQTIGNQQNQAKLQANHLSTVGPPATEISKGNAIAAPTQAAPTTPAPTYTVVGPSGATGQRGPAPTDAQVNAAVSRYFAAHPVKPPVSATKITEEAATFVARYLREHPAPAGKDGSNGTDGTSGSPGPSGAPGVQGPGPTNEQIATAVQNYLPAAVAAYLVANPPASGAPGSPGPSGPMGNPGPSGPSGATGSEGPPPLAWNWTDPDGTKHVCSKDANSSDAAPTYTCT